MPKESTMQAVQELIERCPALDFCRAEMEDAVKALCASYRAGKKLLVCGNGGSASDAEHIVGELMKGFLLPRKLPEEFCARLEAACSQSAKYLAENLQGALPAISLVNQLSLNTAFANDQAPDLAFAQQVYGIGEVGDVFLGISTSGNSSNVLYAFDMARAKGLKTIALTGRSGGKIRKEARAEIVICVPEDETFRIQEYHLPVYHMLCIALEREFFSQ